MILVQRTRVLQQILLIQLLLAALAVEAVPVKWKLNMLFTDNKREK
jgi:hypothetical protein